MKITWCVCYCETQDQTQPAFTSLAISAQRQFLKLFLEFTLECPMLDLEINLLEFFCFITNLVEQF